MLLTPEYFLKRDFVPEEQNDRIVTFRYHGRLHIEFKKSLNELEKDLIEITLYGAEDEGPSLLILSDNYTVGEFTALCRGLRLPVKILPIKNFQSEYGC